MFISHQGKLARVFTDFQITHVSLTFNSLLFLPGIFAPIPAVNPSLSRARNTVVARKIAKNEQKRKNFIFMNIL